MTKLKDLNVVYNYFPDKNTGLVVECGTAQGNMNPSLYLEETMGWDFVGFEPDPRFFPIFKKNRPNATHINLALSNSNGMVEFMIAAHGGNSSLNHTKTHTEELKGYGKFSDGSFVKPIQVQTITWKSFINTYKIKAIDFMILDVEGCEMTVLDSMVGSDVLPDVLQIEFAYSDRDNTLINEEDKTNFSGFKILKDKLVKMGYEFDYLNSNNLFFSKIDFWKDKSKPSTWFGEDTQFHWNGYCQYDKEKCENL